MNGKVPYRRPGLQVPGPVGRAHGPRHRRNRDHCQERVQHGAIQRGVIGTQPTAVVELRDHGEIKDGTLREIERELDLEELRMEA
jgi:hypothetical protein